MQPIKVYLRFRSTSSQLHHASQQRKQHSLDMPTIRHYVSTKYSSAVSTVCRRYISCCSAELNCSTLGPVPLSGVYPILDYADDVVLFFSTVVALVTASVRY